MNRMPLISNNATRMFLGFITVICVVSFSVSIYGLEKTYTNAITAISPEKAALPIHFATDRQCLEVCFKTIGMVPTQEVRMVRIKNTLDLERLWISKALESNIYANANLEFISPWAPLVFDHDDNFCDMTA